MKCLVVPAADAQMREVRRRRVLTPILLEIVTSSMMCRSVSPNLQLSVTHERASPVTDRKTKQLTPFHARARGDFGGQV